MLTPDVFKSTLDFSKTASTKAYKFIATSSVLSNLSTLKNILTSLTNDGFLLSIEAAKNVPSEEALDELNCKLISKFVIERGVCLLIRKVCSYKFISPDYFFICLEILLWFLWKMDRLQYGRLPSQPSSLNQTIWTGSITLRWRWERIKLINVNHCSSFMETIQPVLLDFGNPFVVNHMEQA